MRCTGRPRPIPDDGFMRCGTRSFAGTSKWMKTERFLPRLRRVLLLAVRDGDRRVDVDHQPGSEVGARSSGPGPFPRTRAHRVQAGEVFGIDPVEHPPRRGVTGHGAE